MQRRKNDPNHLIKGTINQPSGFVFGSVCRLGPRHTTQSGRRKFFFFKIFAQLIDSPNHSELKGHLNIPLILLFRQKFVFLSKIPLRIVPIEQLQLKSWSHGAQQHRLRAEQILFERDHFASSCLVWGTTSSSLWEERSSHCYRGAGWTRFQFPTIRL